MGCFIRYCIAWNVKAGSSPAGARQRTVASGNTILSRRTERKPCKSSANSGSPFQRYSNSCGRNNMFNLNQAIAQWRRQMLQAGIKPRAVLDELETHLRDDVERQTKLGTNAQQAFDIAVQSFGKADVLKSEFKKARGPSSGMEKLMIGICG